MTLHDLDIVRPDADLTDEQLAESARSGDLEAFDELYRRHSTLATSYARSILRSRPDAEDAAADAFADVLAALSRHNGPRRSFRPYLLACVRNRCVRRRRARIDSSTDVSGGDAVAPVADATHELPEREIVAKAFNALTERWRTALWMAEVEGLDLDTVADRMCLTTSAAAAMLYRARQAFAEAYLAQHLERSDDPRCVHLAPRMVRYVRGAAGPMSRSQVEQHLESCAACAAALAELHDVNNRLRTLAAPPLGMAATVAAYSAAGAGSSGVATGFAGGWLATAALATALVTIPIAAEPGHTTRRIVPPSTSHVLQTPTESVGHLSLPPIDHAMVAGAAVSVDPIVDEDRASEARADVVTSGSVPAGRDDVPVPTTSVYVGVESTDTAITLPSVPAIEDVTAVPTASIPPAPTLPGIAPSLTSIVPTIPTTLPALIPTVVTTVPPVSVTVTVASVPAACQIQIGAGAVLHCEGNVP